jgi:hypothetical protein
MVGIPELASLVISTITPWLPYLTKATEAAAKGFAGAIGKSGGEAAWKAAEAVWTRVTGAATDDAKLGSVIELLKSDPADADSLVILRKTLQARLERDPRFHDTLLEALGGEQSAQEMIARQGSRISGATQTIDGEGRQHMEAIDDSVIENSDQSIRR